MGTNGIDEVRVLASAMFVASGLPFCGGLRA
jgi:hypothetical protein